MTRIGHVWDELDEIPVTPHLGRIPYKNTWLLARSADEFLTPEGWLTIEELEAR